MIVALLLFVLLTAGDVAAESYRRSEWPWRTSACQTTRTRVLIRDAQSVELDAAKCVVAAGAWVDRYTGAVVDDPRALDIDHVVPLKWAHDHGAAGWTATQKKEFANFLGYRYALVAVSASANRAKGSKGPEAWRPPNVAEHCQYAQSFATVIVISGLQPTQATRDAIRAMATTC